MKTLSRIAILLIIIGLPAWWYNVHSGDASVAVSFRTEAATRGDIKAVVSSSGTLNPVKLIDVGSQASGQVTHIHVHVNDHVKLGQPLADIDPALTLAQTKQDNANLETARSTFEQAGRDLERTRVLLQKDYVAKVDLEHAQQTYLSAKNGYEGAKSVMERDKVNLDYTKIVSPIDGVVIAVDVAEGQTLAASFQTPNMFKIAGSLSQMKIEANFSEDDINKVKVGMPATFTVNAFSDREFTGRVESVNLSPTATQGYVSYAVTIVVENKDEVLLPGMTAYVSVILSEKNKVLRIPMAALRFTPPEQQLTGFQRMFRTPAKKSVAASVREDKNNKTVYVLRNNEPVPVSVALGATDETYVEITGEGIAEGDEIIIGLQKQKKQ